MSNSYALLLIGTTASTHHAELMVVIFVAAAPVVAPVVALVVAAVVDLGQPKYQSLMLKSKFPKVLVPARK